MGGRTNDEQEVIAALAGASWRLAQQFQRVVARLDAGEQARFMSQHRWYVRQVEEQLQSVGISVVNLEGQLFEPGIAATAVNAADFSPTDVLLIDQMVEPIVMGPEGVLRSGTVLLRKVQS